MSNAATSSELVGEFMDEYPLETYVNKKLAELESRLRNEVSVVDVVGKFSSCLES